jgi:hypothetical protein
MGWCGESSNMVVLGLVALLLVLLLLLVEVVRRRGRKRCATHHLMLGLVVFLRVVVLVVLLRGQLQEGVCVIGDGPGDDQRWRVVFEVVEVLLTFLGLSATFRGKELHAVCCCVCVWWLDESEWIW